MREVDEIGAMCRYLAPCESVPCTDITAEQLRALVTLRDVHRNTLFPPHDTHTAPVHRPRASCLDR